MALDLNEKKTCKNHPDRIARRNCFYCGVSICPSCQLKAHHHIFCSTLCADHFKEKTNPQELSAQLQELDRSLNDDFREYGEVLLDGLRGELNTIEERLDVALTSLATMVEGSAQGLSAELDQDHKNLDSGVQKIQRETLSFHEITQDRWKEIQQLVLTTRSSLHDLRQYLEQHHSSQTKKEENWSNLQREEWTKFSQKLEKNQNQLEGFQKLYIDETKNLKKEFYEWNEKKTEELHQNIEKTISEINVFQKVFLEKKKELTDESQALSEKQTQSWNQKLDQTQEGIQNFQNLFLKERNQLEQNLNEFSQKRIQFLQEKIEQTQIHLEHFNKLFSEEKKELGNQIQHTSENISFSLKKDFEDQTEQRKQIQENLDKKLTVQFSFLESLQDQVKQLRNLHEIQTKENQKEVSLLREEMIQKFSLQLQHIFDDVAALVVAHRGSWNEVLTAATKGAKEAGEGLRYELQNRLTEEMNDLTKTVHLSLVQQIKKYLSPWSRKFVYGGIFACFLLLLLLPFYFSRQNQKQMQSLQQKMENDQVQLRSWFYTNLLPSFSKKNQPKEVPFYPSNITRGNIYQKKLAFTFDGGANDKAANEILDILKRRNLRSTIFLTGEFIFNFPELVKRMVEEDHEMGNHLVHHDHLISPDKKSPLITRDKLLEEIHEVEKRFEKVTGTKMSKFWRAPFGEINPQLIQWAASEGYTHVGWTRSGRKSLDTLDWVKDPKSSLYRTTNQIIQGILSFEANDENHLNGAIILMHLGSDRPPQDRPHRKLPELLDFLLGKGYKSVPVSELISSQ